MFTKTLPENAKTGLALLGKSKILDKAYLAGGSSLALQLGHRISVDFDFFTRQEFNTAQLIRQMKKIGRFELEQESWGTVLGIFEGIKFSLFLYKYPVLFPFKSLYQLNILDMRDIAAMKVASISTRGIKRDFVDLYFICKKGFSLQEVLSYYDRKFGVLASNLVHIQKSLVYFVDAESQEMPRMLKKVTWEEIKKYFEDEVKKMNENRTYGANAT